MKQQIKSDILGGEKFPWESIGKIAIPLVSLLSELFPSRSSRFVKRDEFEELKKVTFMLASELEELKKDNELLKLMK